MHQKYPIRLDVKIEKTKKWKKMLDLAVEIIDVPVALILQANTDGMEVLVQSGNSIYCAGETVPFNTGCYCDAVIEAGSVLIVPDARKDNWWKNSPEAVQGFTSCACFPVFWPTGEFFGTVCALDKKESSFPDITQRLLKQYAEIIQDDLKGLAVQDNTKNEMNSHFNMAKSLCESEERFKKAFRMSHAGIITRCSDDKIIDVNEGYSKITGYAYEETVGKTALELCLYADPAERNRLLQKIAGGEPAHKQEVVLKTKSGELKIVELSIDEILIDSEPYLLTNIYNLTPLKKLKHELKTVNKSCALAARAAQAGIWDWNIRNNTLVWDNQMYSIYGVGKREFPCAYEAWEARLCPEDLQNAKMELVRAIDGEKEYNVEFKLCHPDGSVKYIKSYGDIIRDKDGYPVRILGVDLDITEMNALKNALASSEELYKRLFNVNSAIRLVVEVDTGYIMDANSAAVKFYGYPKDRLIGKCIAEINGLPLETTLKNMENAYRRRKNRFQLKHYLHNGEFRHVEAFIDPVEIRKHRCVNYIVHDITEKKKIEERLVESEARYRNLFNKSDMVQLIIDSERGDIIDANPAACAFLGFTADELKQKKLWDFDTSDREFILGKLSNTIKRGKDFFYTDQCRSDGKICAVEVFSCRAEIGGRKLVHAIIHDVTERKQAESGLLESEKRFRLLLENTPDCVFVQTDFKFAYVNKKAVEFFGAASEKELIGNYIYGFFPPEKRYEIIRFTAALNERKTKVPLKSEMATLSCGALVYVEISAVPVMYMGKKGGLFNMRDITERKDYEKSKAEMEMKLRQKQRLESIGTFAGGIAHEINNPVNGIINYAQLILDDADLSGKLKGYCGEIIREGQRAAGIVKNLLSFSRHGKQMHSPAKVSDIINDTVSLIRTVIRHDGIELGINIPEGLPSIKCRSQQIQQVVMNLITNARDAVNEKYMEAQDAKKIALDCAAIEKRGEKWIKITVEDNGTGIPDEVIEKIFDPFFTTKPHEKGTGLGLSISHGIVNDHRGELYFETEIGVYTRAVLELPAENELA